MWEKVKNMPKCLEVTSCQLSVVVAGGSVSRDPRELIDERESFSHMAGDVLYHLFAQARSASSSIEKIVCRRFACRFGPRTRVPIL